ncbi:hypothetical protein BKA15_006789 [Microlunatus parietis]|uniref:Glycoside hydrolase 123 catalytic domain-containing protein n=1 Tax=Microlunatus parietis TaxID=682979 RepID=A0A7Y9IET8_9ACTN|nr:DUF4091 domain-containing protein [Microlunatus parietis]NYE75460.1 hypothetical protein [Microlunatus parietis]
MDKVDQRRTQNSPVVSTLAVLLGLVLTLGLVATAGPAVAAGTVLLTGFEDDSSLRGVTLADPEHDTATRSDAFAGEGSSALRFTLAGTRDSGSTIFPRVWLADGTTLQPADWSSHTYLQVGVANASATPTTLYVVVRDLDGRYLQRSLAATPYDYRVFQIRTADIAGAGVDLDRLQHIQVSAARSGEERVMFVDHVRLSDTAIDESAERAAVVPDLLALTGAADVLDRVDAELAQARELLGSDGGASYAPMKAWIDQVAGRSADLRQRLDQIATPAQLQAMLAELAELTAAPARLMQVLDVRSRRPDGLFGLDTADSMTLVYPKDLPWPSTGPEPLVELARGETEHTQLVVVPYGAALTGVSARVLDIRGPGGTAVPAEALAASVTPIGSLYTVPSSAYNRPTYTGWTPDPLRHDLDRVDLAARDVQPYLVSVDSGTDAAAGTFRVRVAISADGQPEQRITVTVKVWPITPQDRPELRTAFQFTPWLAWDLHGITDPAEREAMRLKYWDFLAEHKIQPDQIYTTAFDPAKPGPGDFRPQPVEDIVKIKERYGLKQFTALYLWAGLLDPNKPETWDTQIDLWIGQLETAMAEYEAAGVADQAVVYGFDESTGPLLRAAEHTFARIKERFPDLPTMTTLRDDTFGQSTGLVEEVDIWVPWVDGYRYDLAEQARANGERVWWYHAISTRYPQPNWFNGYPPIDARMLMGPMSHQSGVEGVLYYATNRWPRADRGDQLLVDDGILSKWNPATYFGTAGDGSIFYPGPDGPMSSLRLENVRDGLEDYNLMQELRRALAEHPDAPAGIRQRAEAALGATAVVRNSRDFTEDPASYREWRREVARTLQLLAQS